MTLRYWGLEMNKVTPIEFANLTEFQKEVAVLAISYQADLMSMKMSDVQTLLSKKDWSSIEYVMKHGKRKSQ